MEVITPEQQAQLSSWASKRDSILREISVAEDRLQTLNRINKNLGESNTEIEIRIQQSIGRLDEMDVREQERAGSLKKDTADLLVEVSQLQTKISDLKSNIFDLEQNRDSLSKSVTTLSETYLQVFGSLEKLQEVTKGVGDSNSQNTKEIQTLLETARHELEKIINVNATNVEKTNIVIEKLPRIIFDLQRDIIERKRLARVKTG